MLSGDLMFTGTGGGNSFASMSSITAGGNGFVTIAGTGANGTVINNGVLIASSSSAQVVDGNLNVDGPARGSRSLNDGVKIGRGTLSATGGGNVLIRGMGSQTATGVLNAGINLLGGLVTTATGDRSEWYWEETQSRSPDCRGHLENDRWRDDVNHPDIDRNDDGAAEHGCLFGARDAGWQRKRHN